MRTIALFAIILLFSAPAGAAAFDRFVNPFGTCSPDGGAPEHNTIQEAVAAATVGELIGVCSGTYAEQVVVATNNLTVRATGASAVHVVAPGPGGPSFGFDVSADGVTVLGFDVSGFGGDGNSCGIRVTGANVTVTGNDAHDNVTGICLIGAESALVFDNRIRENRALGVGSGNGLFMFGGHDNIALRNRVLNNEGEGINDVATIRSLLQQNVATGNAAHGIIVNSSVNARVSRNSTQDNLSDGITIHFSAGALVDRNVASAGRSGGIVASNSSGCTLLLNSVRGNAARGITAAFTSSCLFDGNRVIGNDDVGIAILNAGADLNIQRNSVTGNGGVVDCFWDGSDAPSFANNACRTETPPGAWD